MFPVNWVLLFLGCIPAFPITDSLVTYHPCSTFHLFMGGLNCRKQAWNSLKSPWRHQGGEWGLLYSLHGLPPSCNCCISKSANTQPSCLPEALQLSPLTFPHPLQAGEMLKGAAVAPWHREQPADVINWKIGAKGETASYKYLPSKGSILF